MYLSGDAARTHMPFGLAGIFLAILVFAMIYAKSHHAGAGAVDGARRGLLFGVFIDGAFVAVNYGTINISAKLALELAAKCASGVDSRGHHRRDDLQAHRVSYDLIGDRCQGSPGADR